MARLAVLGVGTGVGKTHTSAGILEAIRSERVVAPFKPVESGTDDNGGVPADAERLLQACGLELDLKTVCPWQLPRPVAPASEFERLGQTLLLDELVQAARELEKRFPNLLFEGAGGVLSPITWDFDATDIARVLGAEVLLVAPDTLGSMSAVRTAVESLQARKLSILGIVLNRFDHDQSVPKGENRRALSRWFDLPVYEVSTQVMNRDLIDRLSIYFA